MNEEKKFTEEKPRKRASSRYRAKSQGEKLKSETSAKKAYGRKFRHGKKNTELTAEEKKKIKKLQVQGRHKMRRDIAENSAAHRQIDNANEDQNVGTEALNKGVETAENAAGVVRQNLYSRKLQRNMTKGGPDCETDCSAFSGMGGKLGSNARTANAKAGNSNYGAGKQAKKAQKDLMKKEFQKAANKKAQKEAANQVGSISKKFVDKAEDLMGRFAEWLAEKIADNPMVLLIILAVLIVVIVISSSAGLAGGMLGSLSDTTIATSYTADDADILTVEQNYKDKEADLQTQINNIPSTHPGYDEYRYNLAEINHNPYQLAALLTVLYEDYTPSEVDAKLTEIFNVQYKLTTREVVETRTRTETRTGTRTVHHSDGTTSTETYTYEVEVEYDWHVLVTTLTNATMDSVVRNMGLTDDQMERYELLLETRGNKAYLFGDDVYSNPDPGEYTDYDIPPEALTDTRFANMVREAEKYLGYPYVWGGSSPSTSFDCSGFVSYVINHCGNGWNVGRQTANGLLTNCCTRVSKDEAKPGDLIFFKGTYDTLGASHVGIYVGNGMMIHCGNPIQYSSINTNYWKNHFYTFGRIK
jgi:cell wall-associated NlpC family hydrolase